MAKGKKKVNDANEDDFEVIDKTELEEEEVKAPAPKGGKKSRKAKKEAELEEAQRELEALNDGDLEPEQQPSKPTNNKKANKKAKAKVESDKEDSDDEVVNEKPKGQKGGFALLMDDDGSNDSESEEEQKPAKKAGNNKKAKPPKKSAFEMMAELDGSDKDSDKEDQVEEEVKEAKTADNKKKKDNKKAKKKAGKKEEDEDELAAALADLGIQAGGAEEDEKAKKKKEKKAKQKMKAAEGGEPSAEAPAAAVAAGEGGEGKKKKKGKKGDGDGGDKPEEPEADSKKKGAKKGPGSKMKEALKEALKKQQEEEERLRLEEEEKIRKAEEAEAARLEKKRLEQEEKERKKQEKKDRIAKMKAEGTYLTAKQKEEKARNEAFLEAMKARGLEVPQAGEKRGPRLGTRIRPNKNWKGKSETPEPETKQPEEDAKVEVEVVVAEKKKEEKGEESDDVADAWDASSGDESDTAEDKTETEAKQDQPSPPAEKEQKKPVTAEEEESEDDEGSESDDDSEDDEDSEDDDDSDEDESEDEEDKAQVALNRIAKRKEANEKARSTENLRAPVVCVLGHVDTGKTKILDKLRRTNVQDGEAGGITQQIGATNVPKEVIQEQCKMVKGFPGIKVPGLLIIDTPGHESFSNLRDRGSSLCDIAILVVDIMHGLEPQTIESINLLKKKKTPFVIALNKVDRLYQWKSNRHKDIEDVVNSQERNTVLEFKKRANEVIASIAEQGLNAALSYENPDPKSYISMVPTSAHSGEGMGNLMGLLVTLSQTRLAPRVAYSEELQATVLEVKAIPGLGTTIDIVLVNGRLKEGQTMILAGTEGPIQTTIKALLTPSKMQDLRVKNTYIEHKEIRAAQGVKIAAKELDKAIAGLNLLVANQPDEVQICKDEISARLSSALNSIKVKDRGVFVQASTLGSLEALLEFLRTSKIPYAGVKIGPVVKRDVMRASVMLEHEPKYTIILAFDVKVERDAQEMADKEGVKIFQADIIYHLFDRFMAYQDELKAKKKEEFKHVAVFPCKLKMMPNCIFNSRDPIVAGVSVEAGIVRTGTPVCVPSKEFVELGIITSIQNNHKEQETARKGEEVCIKIEPIPGESPKMFGRHFDETDMVVSKISRTSIDACKEYFRDDLQKSDWQLMIELKKTFEIL